MRNPIISIVTVTLNCITDAVITAQSVLDQDFTEFEYIVKDGCSTDGTIAQLIAMGINVIVQPDTGVYDGMNQALKYCNGKYICFLNAGDIFVDSKILSDIANWLHNNSDYFYTDIIVNHPDVKTNNLLREIRYYPTKISRKYLYRKMICHQAWFVKKKLIVQKGGFNNSYRICADYDLLLKIVSDIRISKVHIPRLAIEYKGGGYRKRIQITL